MYIEKLQRSLYSDWEPKRGADTLLDTQGRRAGRWAGMDLKGGMFELNLKRMVRL